MNHRSISTPIQAGSNYQEVQAESLPQGRGDVQPAAGHAPRPRAQALARGRRPHPQGAGGQGRHQKLELSTNLPTKIINDTTDTVKLHKSSLTALVMKMIHDTYLPPALVGP